MIEFAKSKVVNFIGFVLCGLLSVLILIISIFPYIFDGDSSGLGFLLFGVIIFFQCLWFLGCFYPELRELTQNIHTGLNTALSTLLLITIPILLLILFFTVIPPMWIIIILLIIIIILLLLKNNR